MPINSEQKDEDLTSSPIAASTLLCAATGSKKKYQIIYADPPWEYKFAGTRSEGTEDDYPTMKTKDICAFNVAELADDNCILFMWGIWTKLQDAIDVMKAWGFEYKTVGFVWVKTNKREKVTQYSFLPADSFDEFFGMGMYTRSNTEFCLIGTKGKPQRISASVRQLVYTPIQQHSRKPDEVRERIVELMGDLPRVELFCRFPKDGWDVWGNQIEATVEVGMSGSSST